MSIELIKKINNNFEINDGYIIVKKYDKENNILHISDNVIDNNNLLYGKIVNFDMKLNDIIDKINNEPKIISIESYFRHDKEGEKETECEYYSDRSTEEKKNEKDNRKSEYHNHWQNIFPIEYLEYKIEENNKKHFADIYIYNNNNKEIEINDENNKSLFKNYKPKSLIIEIQYSKISEETLKERTLFYQNQLKERELILI
jgi:hypothetical protein